MSCTLLFIGTTELLLIGGMALLLFGGKKLPEMMRGLGQGVKEFKKGMNEVRDSVEDSAEEDADAPKTENADAPKIEGGDTADAGEKGGGAQHKGKEPADGDRR